MLTKTKSSCKTGWWLNLDGRPVAKFGRESDIDLIINLQVPSKVIHMYDKKQQACDYSLGA